VRASAVSTRYSHGDDEQLSIASDQETADGCLYVGSFAPGGTFNQTASTFAFDGEASASASFRAHPQQQYSDVSRSLEVEESLFDEQSHDYDDGVEQPPQPQQQQQQLPQQQVQQPQQRRQWSQPADAVQQQQQQQQRNRRSVDSLLIEDRHAGGSAAASVSSSLAEPGPLRQASGMRCAAPAVVMCPHVCHLKLHVSIAWDQQAVLP
jgi:hypothetical protein